MTTGEMTTLQMKLQMVGTSNTKPQRKTISSSSSKQKQQKRPRRLESVCGSGAELDRLLQGLVHFFPMREAAADPRCQHLQRRLYHKMFYPTRPKKLCFSNVCCILPGVRSKFQRNRNERLPYPRHCMDLYQMTGY